MLSVFLPLPLLGLHPNSPYVSKGRERERILFHRMSGGGISSLKLQPHLIGFSISSHPFLLPCPPALEKGLGTAHGLGTEWKKQGFKF